MVANDVTINGKDAYTTWGISFDTSSLSALMTPPPMKPFIEGKSRLEHGKRVIGNNPMTDERTLTLTLNLTAKDETEFFARYNSFCEELKTGVLNISSRHQQGVVYKTIYISCNQFTQFMRGIAKFSLRLNEPNCTDRSV